MTPLAQDAGDVAEACEDAGALTLLKPQTTVGRYLRAAIFEMRIKLLDRLLAAQCERDALRAEVEGLRAQNAALTEAVQEAESARDHAISFGAANTARCEYLEDQIFVLSERDD